ncbi:probable peroxygenase 5 [Macadamia integrifolia]|uniref:probable peroxygenase 5 n=1 Tax=Macadamia integrifolia TaxID=60698 RepID=UPI001C4F4C04|nr:probable peroxygenase 5 [Macadamia integrifolia]
MTSSSVALSDDKQKQGVYDEDLEPLQKHAAFFDRNKDGLIYPWETFKGFRAIGSGIPLSTVAAIFVNVALSGKTRSGKFSPLFPIEVRNVQRGKHGSDSGVYDTEGRFVPEKFEQIFNKHAHTNPNALTSKELSEMLKDNRVPKDYLGWLGAWIEWKVLYSLGKDEDGLLHKDTIRGVYDGTLFEKLEEKKAAHKKA